MKKRIRLIHRNKKRSKCVTYITTVNTGVTNNTVETMPETDIPVNVISPDTDLQHNSITGEVIAERGRYRLVKFDEEDYQCMEKRQGDRYISHRSFESLQQAEFHFYNEHP